MATVQRVLRLHDERKYHGQVPTASQISETSSRSHQGSSPSVDSFSKDSVGSRNLEAYFDYYTIDNRNRPPDEYFAINGDVAEFAKNYERIRQILRVTRDRAAAFQGGLTVLPQQGHKSSARPRERSGYIQSLPSKLSARSQSVNEKREELPQVAEERIRVAALQKENSSGGNCPSRRRKAERDDANLDRTKQKAARLIKLLNVPRLLLFLVEKGDKRTTRYSGEGLHQRIPLYKSARL